MSSKRGGQATAPGAASTNVSSYSSGKTSTTAFVPIIHNEASAAFKTPTKPGAPVASSTSPLSSSIGSASSPSPTLNSSGYMSPATRALLAGGSLSQMMRNALNDEVEFQRTVQRFLASNDFDGSSTLSDVEFVQMVKDFYKHMQIPASQVPSDAEMLSKYAKLDKYKTNAITVDELGPVMREFLLVAVEKCEELEKRLRDIQEWLATDRSYSARKSPAKPEGLVKSPAPAQVVSVPEPEVKVSSKPREVQVTNTGGDDAEEVMELPSKAATKAATSTDDINLKHKLLILYRTGWARVFIHYKSINRATGEEQWHQLEMSKNSIRVPSAMRDQWAEIVLPVQGDVVLLEFSFTDGEGQWDNANAVPGNNYKIFDTVDGNSGSDVYLPSPSSGSTATSTGSIMSPLSYNLPYGAFTVSSGVLRRVRTDLPPITLVTSVDGALVDNLKADYDQDVRQFTEHWECEQAFRGSSLIYNTGRNVNIFMDVCRTAHLPLPDWLLCGVGTAIYRQTSGPRADNELPFEAVHSYEANLRRSAPKFKRHAIAAFVKEHYPFLNVQLEDEVDPMPLKCGYMSLAEDIRRHEVHLASDMLDQFDARVLVSGHGAYRFVDIIPRTAGKRAALEFLMVMGHIPMGASRYMCVCGDSTTDLEVCRGGDAWRTGIVMGSESSELLEWCTAHPTGRDQRMLEARHASGIVDCLRAFGWA